MVTRKATPKPRNQPFEVGRVSTIELILSVTVPNVYPGSITGAGVGCSSMLNQLSSSPFGFRTSARYVVRGRVFNSASRE